MLSLFEDLPPDTMGIEAIGKVTHEDHGVVLILAAEGLSGLAAAKVWITSSKKASA